MDSAIRFSYTVKHSFHYGVSISKRSLWCDINVSVTNATFWYFLCHIKGSACVCLRLRRNENQALGPVYTYPDSFASADILLRLQNFTRPYVSGFVAFSTVRMYPNPVRIRYSNGYFFMLRSQNQTANQICRFYKNDEFDWPFYLVTVIWRNNHSNVRIAYWACVDE